MIHLKRKILLTAKLDLTANQCMSLPHILLREASPCAVSDLLWNIKYRNSKEIICHRVIFLVMNRNF